MGYLCGLNHLVYDVDALAGSLVLGILGAALGREAQHSHAGLFDASHAVGGLGCGVGYLGQLVGSGVGGYSHVAHDYYAVLAILLLVSDEQHSATHA